MKNSVPIKNELAATSVLQVAAHLEDFVAANPQSASTLSKKMPLADLMLHPEKLEAVLKTAEDGVRTTAASSAKRAARSAAPKKRAGNNFEKSAGHATSERKKIEFFLEVPHARSVKLAADFTDWEKSPLDLSRSEDGIWHAAVPLPPGEYLYRFIVDGEWHDDPRPVARVANPFGTSDAVLRVD